MRPQSDRPSLKKQWKPPLAIALCLTAASIPFQAHAQNHHPGYRRTQPPSTNQTANPKTVAPEEKPQKFKDLAVNTEFYYLADKDHKTFPWVKISATSAKSVPTPAKPTSTVASIPSEMQVIAKSSDSKKDTAGK